MWNQQQANIIDNIHEDSDEDIDSPEINNILSRDPTVVDSENGGQRVHNIQRLERALRTAGMAWNRIMEIMKGSQLGGARWRK